MSPESNFTGLEVLKFNEQHVFRNNTFEIATIYHISWAGICEFT